MMALRTECPHCGRVFFAQSSHLHKKLKCPNCSSRFIVGNEEKAQEEEIYTTPTLVDNVRNSKESPASVEALQLKQSSEKRKAPVRKTKPTIRRYTGAGKNSLKFWSYFGAIIYAAVGVRLIFETSVALKFVGAGLVLLSAGAIQARIRTKEPDKPTVWDGILIGALFGIIGLGLIVAVFVSGPSPGGAAGGRMLWGLIGFAMVAGSVACFRFVFKKSRKQEDDAQEETGN